MGLPPNPLASDLSIEKHFTNSDKQKTPIHVDGATFDKLTQSEKEQVLETFRISPEQKSEQIRDILKRTEDLTNKK